MEMLCYSARDMSTKTIPWERIEGLLKSRQRDVAWLREKLPASSNLITNWKTRGVPKGRAQALATLFEVSTDRLLNGESRAQVTQSPFIKVSTNEPELLTQISELFRMWVDLTENERGLVLDFVSTMLRRRGIDSGRLTAKDIVANNKS